QDESINVLIYRVANRASYALSQKLDRSNKRVMQRRKASSKNRIAETDFYEQAEEVEYAPNP
ncbi:hypothetical protein, partial [uncultured Gimesia sp.]|uniref:hypothetical protein n=1 Tax=uncultured Gimesia sp. TaxID=1678688 RepID=UPI00262DA391